MAEPYPEVYEALRTRLGHRPRRDIWQDLISSGYVAAVARGRWTFEHLLAQYRHKDEIYRRTRQARRPAPQREIGPDERSAALSELVTLTIDALIPAVRGFRERHLGSGLLEPEQIAAWIEAQAEREGAPAAAYLVVPLAKEHSYRHYILDGPSRTEYADWLAAEAERVRADAAAELPRGWAEEQLRLRYYSPEEKLKIVRIRGDGLLAELKHIARFVSGPKPFTGWSEEQAVTYILADRVPRQARARARLRYSIVPAASRVDLEVSLRLAPQEVASLYGELRRSFGEERDREMDERHLALALLGQQSLWRGALAELSWPERRERWNERYPQWRYATKDPAARAFALAVRSAWSRLSGDQWPRAWRSGRHRPLGWYRPGDRTWYD